MESKSNLDSNGDSTSDEGRNSYGIKALIVKMINSLDNSWYEKYINKFKPVPELEIFYEGIFQNHYKNCNVVTCYCKNLQHLEEVYTEKNENYEALFENGKIQEFEYHSKLFNNYRELYKRRILVVTNLLLK